MPPAPAKPYCTVVVNARAGTSSVNVTVRVDFQKARDLGRPVDDAYSDDDARHAIAEQLLESSIKIIGADELKAGYRAWLRENPPNPVK